MNCRPELALSRYVLAATLLLAIGFSGGSAAQSPDALPTDSKGWTALGRVRLESADQLGALQLDANDIRAIELRGELVRSQFGVVAAYRALDAGDWQQAIALLKRLQARIGYNDYILLANLARAYSAAGQHKAAIREAAIAYRIAPANTMVTHVYGRVLLKSGQRPKAAVELLEKAAIMMPENAQFARELARAKTA